MGKADRTRFYGMAGMSDYELMGHSDSDVDASTPATSDSDAEDTVVPKCKMGNHTIAYIVSKSSHDTEPKKNIIIYTNSRALPLLVSVKSQWTTGLKTLACIACCMVTLCTQIVWAFTESA